MKWSRAARAPALRRHAVSGSVDDPSCRSSSVSASRVDWLRAVRPPIEDPRAWPAPGAKEGSSSRCQRVVHRARHRAERLGVGDECVGSSRPSGAAKYGAPRSSAYAQASRRAGTEALEHARRSIRLGVSNATSPAMPGVWRKPARAVRKRVTSTSGFAPGFSRRNSLKMARSPKTIDVLLCSARRRGACALRPATRRRARVGLDPARSRRGRARRAPIATASQ